MPGQDTDIPLELGCKYPATHAPIALVLCPLQLFSRDIGQCANDATVMTGMCQPKTSASLAARPWGEFSTTRVALSSIPKRALVGVVGLKLIGWLLVALELTARGPAVVI